MLGKEIRAVISWEGRCICGRYWKYDEVFVGGESSSATSPV
jgi:hypothetical protein